MLTYLSAGVLLGLSAGISPGPLLALVVSETLAKGPRAGVKVALAPLITDLPIVLLSLLVLARLAKVASVLGFISLVGGAFVLYLGYGCLTAQGAEPAAGTAGSLGKGVLVNALSPHPYMFWITVGGPMTVRAAGEGLPSAGAFIGGFYLLLVGSKVALALMAGRFRDALTGRAYVSTLRALGVLLLLLGLFLLVDGVKLLVG